MSLHTACTSRSTFTRYSRQLSAAFSDFLTSSSYKAHGAATHNSARRSARTLMLPCLPCDSARSSASLCTRVCIAYATKHGARQRRSCTPHSANCAPAGNSAERSQTGHLQRQLDVLLFGCFLHEVSHFYKR